MGVFLKDAGHADAFPDRILDSKIDFENGQRLGHRELIKASGNSQNDMKLLAIGQIVAEQLIVS